jgi:hypothetical protein
MQATTREAKASKVKRDELIMPPNTGTEAPEKYQDKMLLYHTPTDSIPCCWIHWSLTHRAMHSLNGNMMSKLPDPNQVLQQARDLTYNELKQQTNTETIIYLSPKPIHKGQKTAIKYKRVNGVNCLISTINVDRKGASAIEHFIHKTHKIRPELPHIWCWLPHL